MSSDGTRPFLRCQGKILPWMQTTSARCPMTASPGTAPGYPPAPHRSGAIRSPRCPRDPPGRVRADESGSGAPVSRRGRREAPPRCAIALLTPRGRSGSDSRAAGQRTCRRSPPARVGSYGVPLRHTPHTPRSCFAANSTTALNPAKRSPRRLAFNPASRNAGRMRTNAGRCQVGQVNGIPGTPC